jgi:hypothetical protein
MELQGHAGLLKSGSYLFFIAKAIGSRWNRSLSNNQAILFNFVPVIIDKSDVCMTFPYPD